MSSTKTIVVPSVVESLRKTTWFGRPENNADSDLGMGQNGTRTGQKVLAVAPRLRLRPGQLWR